MSGLSASRPPNAERCATCHDASASARRISEAEPSTQSSRVAATISMIVRTPRPSSPSRCAQVPSQLQLGGGVGAVAQLVLEAYDVQPVALAVGEHARHQEAGETAGRLRQHQEHVVHRRGGEPLVAVRGCTRRRPRSAAPRSGWPGRRSRPASRSSPCPPARRACARPGAARGRRTADGQPRASTPWRSRRRPAAPGRRRTSSRSGSRGRARSATTRRSRPPGVRARAGRRRSTAPPAARSRRRAPSASATTGGSAPRRSRLP